MLLLDHNMEFYYLHKANFLDQRNSFLKNTMNFFCEELNSARKDPKKLSLQQF